jgi:membrane protease YdiL (CAAX protease family)
MDESRSSRMSFLLFIGLFFIVWTFRATVLYFFDTHIQSESLRNLYSNAAKFVIWVLPVFIYLIKVDDKNPFTYLKLNTRISKANLLAAFIAIILYFSGVLFLSIFLQGKHLLFNLDSVTLLSTSVSSLFEEILFRGFILNKLWEVVCFRLANLMAALLFALVHLPNWLWTKAFQPQILVDFSSIIILAYFLGYLVKKTNSLWVGAAAHIVNNFVASVLRA